MRREKVKGVLDLPFWESAMFWPMICRRQEFFPFVKECMDLPVSKEFYTRCKNGSALFGNKDLDFGNAGFLCRYKYFVCLKNIFISHFAHCCSFKVLCST